MGVQSHGLVIDFKGLMMGKVSMSEVEFRKFFWDKTIPTDTGCRLWVGGHGPHRYGHVSWRDKTNLTHRVAWELTYGPIPKGLYVCHKCDVKLCVNPHHLFLGTALDNNRDMARKNRAWKPKGEKHPAHKLTEEAVIDILTSGLGRQELAKKYGISVFTVHDIRKGRRWSHVKALVPAISNN
jgi:hypothetical protein